MFPLAAASTLSRRLCGRVARGPFVPNSLTRSCRLGPSTQRSFNDWGSPIPEPEFTPGETILLDVTAWIVALAMVYAPSDSKDLEEKEITEHGRLRTGKKDTQDTPRASRKDH